MIDDWEFVSCQDMFTKCAPNAFDRPRRSLNISTEYQYFQNVWISGFIVNNMLRVHWYLNTTQLIEDLHHLETQMFEKNHPGFLETVKNVLANYNLNGNEI